MLGKSFRIGRVGDLNADQENRQCQRRHPGRRAALHAAGKQRAEKGEHECEGRRHDDADQPLDAEAQHEQPHADRRRCGHPNRGTPLNRAMDRRIFTQRPVCSDFIVIVSIPSQSSLQVRLAHYDEMIQAVTPDRSDQPLGIAILPWRRRRNGFVPDGA